MHKTITVNHHLRLFIFCLLMVSGAVLFASSTLRNIAKEYAQSGAPNRTITFAGVEWQVKSGGPMGPGPNYWTDSPQDVWVDEEGRLHLRIVKKGNVWYCSEVYTRDFSSHGEHRFLVDGYIDRMDQNIVLGLFVYAHDEAEIDIEYSKWGQGANYKRVGGYNIQPYYRTGNSHQFESPLNQSQSTHFFNWQEAKIEFGSMQGHHYQEPPSSEDYIQKWTYSGADNPDPSLNLRTHINFWMFAGNAPQDLSVLEVIISDVLQPLRNTNGNGGQGAPLPQAFILDQNYPNPFNTATVIPYQIVNPGEAIPIDLSVYNIRGQKIVTLVNTRQTVGNYQAEWDGEDFPGSIYYYRLKTPYGTKTRKMILIR